jgi:hypothetical protein
MIWTYRSDQEDPSWVTDVVEADGTAVDLSAMTLELKLVDKVLGTTALTKTSNVVGTAGGRMGAGRTGDRHHHRRARVPPACAFDYRSNLADAAPRG